MKEIESIKAQFSAKYHVSLDGDTACLLYEIREITQPLENAIAELYQKEAIKTENSKVAFWYGIGKNMAWCILALTLFISTCFVYVEIVKQEDNKRLHALAIRYPNFGAYEGLMQNAKIITNANGMFLLVNPTRNKTIIGQTYLTTGFKKPSKEAENVYIPLQFK